MATDTDEQLTLFAADHPVSQLHRPGSEAARAMTVGSGRKRLESHLRFVPDGCSLRTLTASLLSMTAWHSTVCFLKWNTPVTKSKRLIFQLAESVPTTFAIDSGLLPTPTASEYGTGQNGQRPDGSTFAGAGMPSLETMARRGMIPTPQATDANAAGSRNTEQSKAHPGVSLTDWAKQDLGAGRQTSRGQLNPRFVEQLMGYPEDWTSVD